jgi:hypothetical protein
MNEHVYAVLSRSIEDIYSRFQASMTTAEAKKYRRVSGNAAYHTVFCLKYVEAASNSYCNY